jgi:hypothetical protein
MLSRYPGRAEFHSVKLHEWEISTCPMSTMAFAAGPEDSGWIAGLASV